MIDINPSRAIITAGEDSYTDSLANLQTHSEGVFTGLPDNVRQYMRREDNSEYWTIAKGSDVSQELPSADFSLMMDSVAAMLPILLDKQVAAKIPSSALDLPETSTVKLGQAFEFNALYTGDITPNLSLALGIVSMDYNEGVNVSIALTALANPVQLMFKQAGSYRLTFNSLEYIVEVT